jgi:hypothetical protein
VNEERTGKCLRQVEHIRGHLWHRYSITVNQVMVGTVKFPKWWLQLYQKGTPQIASQCWANVGILLTTSLDQRWQITLAQRDFAHRAFVGPTCWQFVIGTTSSGISYLLRDIYSICRFCWNVATYKWKVHNRKIEIISFVVKFRS